MKKLQLYKTASDVAFDTAAKTNVEFDAAVTAKAAELALNDADYQHFKNVTAQFRNQFLQAKQMDDAAAARAATAAPAGK